MSSSPRRLPLFQGILPIDKATIPAEVLAGITLAALAIPEVMGYSTIAGMPVVTGLYTLVLPALVFAILGSSRHLVVGADSATAAVMAAALAGMATAGSDEYIALAGLTAIMAAVLLVGARLIKLGFIADFLSRTVLIGFLTGVGIQVAIGQIPGMLGITGVSGGTLEKLWESITNLGDTSMTTLAVSVSVIVVIKGIALITKKVPGALIAVIGALAVSYWADLAAHGVSTLGPLTGGLPSLGIPKGLTWSDVAELVPTAISLLVLILAQSAATSRAYAAKYNDKFSENVDLIGLGGASLAAGLSGTFVVNGSPTKTQMVDSAGGKSQLAQTTTVAIVVIVLLFLTKPLQYLPNAVLAAIVFLIGLELVDWKGMARIARLRQDEFVVALLTAVTVVVVGVEQGIVLAIVASVIDHLRRSYKPHSSLLAVVDGHIVNEPVAPTTRALPGIIVLRWSAPLYYANANGFLEQVTTLVSSTEPDKVTILALDLAAVPDVDYSAAETLRQVHDVAAEHDVRIVFAEVEPGVKDELDRFGLTELFGADAFYESVGELLDTHRA